MHLLHQGQVKIHCLQHFYHSSLQTPGWMTSSLPLSYCKFLLHCIRLDLTSVLNWSKVSELTSKTVRICHIKTQWHLPWKSNEAVQCHNIMFKCVWKCCYQKRLQNAGVCIWVLSGIEAHGHLHPLHQLPKLVLRHVVLITVGLRTDQQTSSKVQTEGWKLYIYISFTFFIFILNTIQFIYYKSDWFMPFLMLLQEHVLLGQITLSVKCTLCK